MSIDENRHKEKMEQLLPELGRIRVRQLTALHEKKRHLLLIESLFVAISPGGLNIEILADALNRDEALISNPDLSLVGRK